jgi:hypothetical protein
MTTRIESSPLGHGLLVGDLGVETKQSSPLASLTSAIRSSNVPVNPHSEQPAEVIEALRDFLGAKAVVTNA